MKPEISIIIPTYNEEMNIARLLDHLEQCQNISSAQIIVCDGNSTDKTILSLKNREIVVLKLNKRGRAYQMNCGAEIAESDLFYFLHADVLPPKNFIPELLNWEPKSATMACFRYRFESEKILLKFNSYMTRFNGIWSGGGDQSLAIHRDLFSRLGGFNEELRIMEDFDLIERAKKLDLSLKILPFDLKVSARKYDHNSWLKVQLVNLITLCAWKAGLGQSRLYQYYSNALQHNLNYPALPVESIPKKQ